MSGTADRSNQMFFASREETGDYEMNRIKRILNKVDQLLQKSGKAESEMEDDHSVSWLRAGSADIYGYFHFIYDRTFRKRKYAA